ASATSTSTATKSTAATPVSVFTVAETEASPVVHHRDPIGPIGAAERRPDTVWRGHGDHRGVHDGIYGAGPRCGGRAFGWASGRRRGAGHPHGGHEQEQAAEGNPFRWGVRTPD